MSTLPALWLSCATASASYAAGQHTVRARANDGLAASATASVAESTGTVTFVVTPTPAAVRRHSDVAVEGVSMSVTQRSEFSSVIQRGGGQIEALLDTLRQRVGSAG